MNLAKKGTIASVKKISKLTFEVAIKVPKGFDFVAGQYIWLQIPELKYGDIRGNTRMFSIASSPNKRGILEIVFRNSKSGYKRTLIQMRRGAEVVFSGPYGSMRLPKHKGQPVVIVAGGVAVAPFLSMIRFSNENHTEQMITLISVNSKGEKSVYHHELEEIEKRNSKFKLIKIFGHLKDGTLADFGNSNPIWYVTGPQDFVNSAAKIINKTGARTKDIIFEQFYPRVITNKRLEQRIKASGRNNPFFLAVESTSNHVIITDTNGAILYANKKAQELTGYTFEEMRGNTPRLWGGLMTGDFYKNLWLLKKFEKTSYVGEVKNRRKNQDEYFAFMNTSPIIDGNTLLGYISIEEDITKQKEREKDLEDAKIAARNVLEDIEVEKEKIENAKAKDDALFESMGDGLVAVDNNAKVIVVNKSATDILGWKMDELIGKTITDLPLETEAGIPIPQDKRPTTLALSSSAAIRGIYYFVRKDKTRIPIAVTATPVKQNGKVSGLIEIIRDVTHELEVDRAKTEFVSLASHQLRTPLTSISWYTEMILNGDLGAIPPEQKKYLEEIYQGNRRLIDLVNTLLDVSRIELGTFKAEPKPTDIVALAKSVLGEQKMWLEEKQLVVKEEYSQNIPIFSTDPKLLRIIFQNLLHNAVKYTPKGGKIEYAVSFDGKKNILIKVSDTGYGIPKNQRDKIFTKLFRADNARAVDPNGTGLGLYIVQSILKNSGGKIWFDSEENRGTTFYVEFPMDGMKNP